MPRHAGDVSRDIRELGLVKHRDALGRPRYVQPQLARRADPQAVLRGILEQFGRTVTAAQNIVVLQSELGSAPAIARALDRVEHDWSSARSRATTRAC